MSALKIQIHGSKVLREVAKEIDIKDKPGVDIFLNELLETLETTKTGVGIAAPQVGSSIRAFISWADRSQGKEPKFFINPVITEMKGAKKNGMEGCLSIPGVYASVERFQKVRVTYLDENWEQQDKLFKNFEARVIQHEFDHLEGKEFFDHLSPSQYAKIKYDLDKLENGEIPELEYEYALQ